MKYATVYATFDDAVERLEHIKERYGRWPAIRPAQNGFVLDFNPKNLDPVANGFLELEQNK